MFHILTNTGYYPFFFFSIATLEAVKQYLVVALNCVSLITNGAEHTLTFQFAASAFSWQKCPFKSFLLWNQARMAKAKAVCPELAELVLGRDSEAGGGLRELPSGTEGSSGRLVGAGAWWEPGTAARRRGILGTGQVGPPPTESVSEAGRRRGSRQLLIESWPCPGIDPVTDRVLVWALCSSWALLWADGQSAAFPCGLAIVRVCTESLGSLLSWVFLLLSHEGSLCIPLRQPSQTEGVQMLPLIL